MPSILGTRVLRREDRGFLTEGATYTADLDDPVAGLGIETCGFGIEHDLTHGPVSF